MIWQVGLSLQLLVSEVLKGTQVLGLESGVVDVLALLNQPRALDRALARYVVSARDVFASATNIRLCTDTATASSFSLQATIIALPDNRAALAPPHAYLLLYTLWGLLRKGSCYFQPMLPHAAIMSLQALFLHFLRMLLSCVTHSCFVLPEIHHPL